MGGGWEEEAIFSFKTTHKIAYKTCDVNKLTLSVQCALMPSSMKEILVSFSLKGGVRDLPGDTEGDAKGVVRRPDLRMDGGVNSANPEEVADRAKDLAFYGKEQRESHY